MRTVIRQAKKREFQKCVSLEKNKTKTLWQIINKEMQNSRHKVENTELRNNTRDHNKPTTNLREVELFFLRNNTVS